MVLSKGQPLHSHSTWEPVEEELDLGSDNRISKAIQRIPQYLWTSVYSHGSFERLGPTAN